MAISAQALPGVLVVLCILSRSVSMADSQPGYFSFSKSSKTPQVNKELLVREGASGALGGILRKWVSGEYSSLPGRAVSL